MGLHRLRESGLAPDLMDALDERPLNLDDIYQLCDMLFLGESSSISLPHPKQNWDDFLRVLTVLVKEGEMQWSTIKRKHLPWIDLWKLEAMHNEQKETSLRTSYVYHPPDKSMTERTYEPKHVYTVSKNPEIIKTARDMMSVIHRWSHESPGYIKMYSLDHLLLTFPKIAALAISEYTCVEPHNYFWKWKVCMVRMMFSCLTVIILMHPLLLVGI